MNQYIVIDKIVWVDTNFDDYHNTGYIEIHLLDKTSIKIDFDDKEKLESFVKPILEALPPTIGVTQNVDEQ